MDFSRIIVMAAAIAAVSAPNNLAAQTRGVVHGQKPGRLVIRNATIVDGNGAPARGPVDIVVENGLITNIINLDPVSLRGGRGRGGAGAAADVQIDATGKYVLPGLINAHGHLQSTRGQGMSFGGYEYNLKLWLASGITSVREVGSESDTEIVNNRDRLARAGNRRAANFRVSDAREREAHRPRHAPACSISRNSASTASRSSASSATS